MQCFKNKKGISFVEVLIMSGILVAAGLVFANMMVSQNAQINFLDNRMARVGLESLLLQRFGQSSVCNWQLVNKTFDVTGITDTVPSKTVLDFSHNNNSIYTGGDKTSPVLVSEGSRLTARGNSPQIATIRVQNIFKVSPDLYSGDLTISFNGGGVGAGSTGNFSMQPAVLKIFISVDSASPDTNKKIASCGSASAGAEEMELIWSGNVGGTGDRTYGNQMLISGKNFSDYKRIYIIGDSLFLTNPSQNNQAIGITGKVHGYISVFLMKNRPDYLFDIQTFSGDDSGAVGVQYVDENHFRWGTYRGGKLNEIWGVK